MTFSECSPSKDFISLACCLPRAMTPSSWPLPLAAFGSLPQPALSGWAARLDAACQLMRFGRFALLAFPLTHFRLSFVVSTSRPSEKPRAGKARRRQARLISCDTASQVGQPSQIHCLAIKLLMQLLLGSVLCLQTTLLVTQSVSKQAGGGAAQGAARASKIGHCQWSRNHWHLS